MSDTPTKADKAIEQTLAKLEEQEKEIKRLRRALSRIAYSRHPSDNAKEIAHQALHDHN